MNDSLPIVLENTDAPIDACWRRIGVSGDRSCPELVTYIHCRNCPVLARAASTFFDRNAPEGYLESWRAILEEPEIPTDSDALSVLIFRLGREWMSLPTATLVEITTLRRLHRVPHRTSTILEGLVNIRGQLQLCFSLHGLLELESKPPVYQAPQQPVVDADFQALPSARLLVVDRSGQHGAERWVFAVDEVAGVQRVARSAMRAVPSTVSHAGARSTLNLFDFQEQTVGILDPARIFEGLRDLISS